MLYELHRILTEEHRLLISLQEKDGKSNAITVASTPDTPTGFWTQLLEVFRPRDAKRIKKKIQTHMKKIERTKRVTPNNIEGYFKNMDLLKRDEISKALKGPETNNTIKLIEEKLAAESIDTKKEAVKQLGPLGALQLLVSGIVSEISKKPFVSLVQGAAITCVLACLVRVYSVPPVEAMEQRLFGMVTTGDFLESSQGNWLTGFARAVTFQGNSLFFETERSVTIPNPVSIGIDELDKRISLVNLTNVASLSLLAAPEIKLPYTSSALLKTLQEYSNWQKEYRIEYKKAEAKRAATKTIEAQAQNAMIDTVIDTGFLLVDAPKEVGKFTIKNFIKASKYFGSNLVNRLMGNKLQILIDSGRGAMKYGIALGHEKIKYHERMNEGIVLMIDNIVSSIILSCLLQAAAYLAESVGWKKMSKIWTVAERTNRYYRIANVFIYSTLLTLVDAGLNDGIESLAQYTGIEMLGDLQVGQVAALTFINGCTATQALISLRDDTVNAGFKLLRLIGKTSKRMLNGQRNNTKPSYEQIFKKDKTREMIIMAEKRNKRLEPRKKSLTQLMVEKKNKELEHWQMEMIQQIIDYNP